MIAPNRETRDVEPWELEAWAEEMIRQAKELRRVAGQAHRQHGLRSLTLPATVRGTSLVGLKHILADAAQAARKAVSKAKGGAE